MALAEKASSGEMRRWSLCTHHELWPHGGSRSQCFIPLLCLHILNYGCLASVRKHFNASYRNGLSASSPLRNKGNALTRAVAVLLERWVLLQTHKRTIKVGGSCWPANTIERLRVSNDSTMSIAERSPTTIAAFSFPSPKQQHDPGRGSRLPQHLPWDRWDPHTQPTPDLTFRPMVEHR